jgi:hypothetical protein
MFDKMKQLFELQGKMQAVKKELENSQGNLKNLVLKFFLLEAQQKSFATQELK